MNDVSKRTRLALGLSYPIVWAVSVAAYWFFMSPSDVMGYTLVFIYVLNPVAILAISFLIGAMGARGGCAWTVPVLFGAAYMLLPYVTFSLANTLTTGSIHVPEIGMMLLGAALSAISLYLGRHVGRKRKFREK